MFQDDGRPVFALVDPRGIPLLYAAAPPNYQLDSYVGKQVALYGLINYHQNDDCLRNHVMTVYYVSSMKTQNPY
jgi:hypothetical protein